ncbi:hypothetical protein BDA96_07G013000 [Sorghum bicolor]|uniref:Uncharacterized protein n=2 Tax=Sorghum bicolor TaxID=4558 RepID=A0A1B6PF37_SORBI|nr:hypothetical protein BDA96_07G013000 [Sorghum bicolor]KXG24237.2 hypothetical protein SORBI_3007G012600 [Sorghum bicolor]
MIPTTVRSGRGVGLVRVSLPGYGRAPATVRSGGGVGLLLRVSLPRAGRAPTTIRSGGGVGLVRASLPGATRTVGRFPPSRANFAKPAEQGPPGHLKGAALAGLLTCYKPAAGAALCYVSNKPSPSLNDPSSLNDASLHQKLDAVLDGINQLHQKLDMDMMGMKRFLWRIMSAVASVFCVLLITAILYIVADGRAYMEAELNKLAKAMFLSFTSDDKVKERLQKLIEEEIDTTFYHIASLKTWYRWLRGK